MSDSPFVDGKKTSRTNATAGGALQGLSFAVKDLYDVQGMVSGCGNKRWDDTHGPAAGNAAVIDLLLDAGATLVGKTITDEMAFSLDGENCHYGTPLNPRCPDRIPGGSSSGSASAVASRLADFALGTDTAGSVRVPASFCGLYGIRATAGLLSTKGIHPLSRTFDTVGWFARNIEVLSKVGNVFYPISGKTLDVDKVFLANDLFALLNKEDSNLFDSAIETFAGKSVQATAINILEGGPDKWASAFSGIQWSDLNRNHGDWIRENIDSFGKDIAERLRLINTITAEEEKQAREFRAECMSRIDALLGDDSLVLMPTVHDIAPKKRRHPEAARAFRSQAIKCNLLASFTGIPQITLPLVSRQGCPIGLSVAGPRGSDMALLDYCRQLMRKAD